MGKYLLMAMLGLSIANTRVEPATVVSSTISSATTFVDSTGNTWQVDGEGLPVNTNVYLVFDTQGTEEIKNDAIISVIMEGGVLYE